MVGGHERNYLNMTSVCKKLEEEEEEVEVEEMGAR